MHDNLALDPLLFCPRTDRFCLQTPEQTCLPPESTPGQTDIACKPPGTDTSACKTPLGRTVLPAKYPEDRWALLANHPGTDK